MAKNSQLKVLEVCNVAPKPNSAAQSPPLPLTFFDMALLRFFPSQRLFFYETNVNMDTLVHKLKLSLSITLKNYLQMAGNLVWSQDTNKPIIQYSEGDDGVSFTVGESSADFHDLASGSFREVGDFYHLVPELPNSETRIPVMSLQVTLFPDVGFCIGYAIHHVVGDGKSIAMFMHSWAFTCKSIDGEDSPALLPELTPFYGRSLIKDPTNLEQRHMNYWLGRNDESNKRNLCMLGVEATDDTVLGTVELRMEEINNLKKAVSSKWQEKDTEKHRKTHVSSYTVTTAYVWICLVKTRLGRMAAGENVECSSAEQHLITAADCRARMDPPIPSTYFGNCITGIVIDVTLKDLFSEQGLAITAQVLGEAIEHLKDGVLKGEETLLKKISSCPPGSLSSVAGSSRFELYKTDFGWGNPRRVKLISNARNGAFAPCDSRNSDGVIEMGIALKKNEVEEFVKMFHQGLETLSIQ